MKSNFICEKKSNYKCPDCGEQLIECEEVPPSYMSVLSPLIFIVLFPLTFIAGGILQTTYLKCKSCHKAYCRCKDCGNILPQESISYRLGFGNWLGWFCPRCGNEMPRKLDFISEQIINKSFLFKKIRSRFYLKYKAWQISRRNKFK